MHNHLTTVSGRVRVSDEEKAVLSLAEKPVELLDTAFCNDSLLESHGMRSKIPMPRPRLQRANVTASSIHSFSCLSWEMPFNSSCLVEACT